MCRTLSCAMEFLGKIVLWTGLALWGLSNFGVEVSAVVAGLGSRAARKDVGPFLRPTSHLASAHVIVHP